MSADMGFSDSNTDSSSQSHSVTEQNLNRSSQATGSYTNGAVNAGQLLEALKTAQGTYETVAPQGTAAIGSGLSSVNQGAAGAAATYGAANPTMQATLSGAYLDPATNPGFQTMVDRTLASTMPAISGGYEAWGRYGGGLATHALSQGANDAVGQLVSQNYQAERANQQQALGMTPSYTAGMMQPGQTQMAAGYQPLQQYLSALSTVSPGTTGQYSNASDTQQRGSSVTDGSQQGNSNTMAFGTQSGAKIK